MLLPGGFFMGWVHNTIFEGIPLKKSLGRRRGKWYQKGMDHGHLARLVGAQYGSRFSGFTSRVRVNPGAGKASSKAL
ncbi:MULTISPECIES: hypothetical protein [Paraburkholderia]|jgi:hypothetical protein|uniref:hypothetical protein n=1 Tax=Paraburkholderia TaxID=1822464 RepID=UPI00115FA78C|nr:MULTISPECIES: hypothetical protein [Paraburkholderia]